MRMVGSALVVGLLLVAAGCTSYQPGPRPLFLPPPDYSPRSEPGYPPPPPYRPGPEPDYNYMPPAPAGEDSRWRITRRRGETDYELPDKIFFGLDSARISRRAGSALAEIARAARNQPDATLVVEGHTDTSGTWEHNRELSEARARAVATVLTQEGVQRDRIRVEGLGKRDLAIQTGDGVREPRNRRVVIRLIDNPRSSYNRNTHVPRW